MHTMPLMGRGLTDGGARHGDDEVAATVTGAGRVCPLRVWKNGVEENGGGFTEQRRGRGGRFGVAIVHRYTERTTDGRAIPFPFVP